MASRSLLTGVGAKVWSKGRALELEALEPRVLLSGGAEDWLEGGDGVQPDLLIQEAAGGGSGLVVEPDMDWLANSLVVSLSCGDFEFVPAGREEMIVAEGFGLTGDSGNPQLPSAVVRLALPPSADLDTVSLEVVETNLIDVPGTHWIGAAPPAATGANGELIVDWGQGKLIEDGKNVLVYGQDEFYGAGTVELLGAEQMRKWKIVTFEYSPFQYNPVSGQLRLAADVQVDVSFELGPLPDDALLADQGADDLARDMLANYEQVSWLYSVPARLDEGGPLPSDGSADYVIITTSAIQSGSTQLDDFVAHKQALGYQAEVITEAAWGGGSGNTAAQNIRSWLGANYASMGIEYVLLIGDPDPGSGNVPMKMLWPRLGAGSYEESPSDYYYADLTSNWDTDGDGYYGEWGDDLSTQPLHEVLVGRIPVYASDYTELDSILAKTIAYDSESSVDWRSNVLLPMAISNYANEDYSGYDRVDAVSLAEYIKDDIAVPNSYGYYRLYEQAGNSPVTAPCEAAISNANVIGEWSSEPYGVVDWWGHGSETGAFRKYWSSDDGDGVPEAAEMTWVEFIQSSDCPSLDDSHPSLVVQISCTNGYPEYDDNLGYSLLANGAIGTYSASRVSWYVVATWDPSLAGTYGDNASYAYYITQRMVENDTTETASAALQWCRENFGMAWAESWMNTLDFNLYGDPTVMLGARILPGTDLLGTSFDVSPHNLQVAGGTAAVDFTVTNNGDTAAGAFDVQFYLSDDATIDPATDVLLTLDASDPSYDPGEPEAYHIAGLGGSSQHIGSVSLAVPAADPFGSDNDYYIGVVVDADEDVTETSETNNANRGEGLDSEDVFYVTPASYPFLEDWEAGTFAGYWRVSEGAQGRIQVTSANGPYVGAYHVTLDDTTDDSTYSLNRLTLCIDLSGQTGVELIYANREWGDEDHAQDRVEISVDGGSSWHTVAALTGANSTQVYTERIFDLDALGLTYSADTLVRFQQYDNSPIGVDGMAFDDIALQPESPHPDLLGTSFAADPYELSLASTTSVTFEVTNQGDGDAAAFDVEFFWSDDPVMDNGDEIAANLAPGDPNYDPANPNAYHVPAGLVASASLLDTIAISVLPTDPFGTDDEYYLGMRVDESRAVSESDETNNHSRGAGLDMAQVSWVATILLADFEDDGGAYENEGFTYTNDPDAPGTNLWHATSHRSSGSHSDPYSQYYGQENVWHYDTGVRTAGNLVSPTVNLVGFVGPITLSFNYFLETEGLAPDYDAAVVQVSGNGGSSWSALAGNQSGGGLTDPTANWVKWEGNLSAYAGSQIILRFNFDTGDGLYNDYEGWYVDDVTMKGIAVAPGEIHGSKWNDLDGDGTGDAGEPGLEGWTIYLDQNHNGQLDPAEAHTTTGADGGYSFLNLLPGTYTVAEQHQSGWTQTWPAGAGTYTVPVASGEVVEDVEFGNWLTQAEIHGSKWEDLDADGVWDAAEDGLAGWTIYLDQNQNGQHDPAEASTTTAAGGGYSFTSLPAGTYTVAEVLQADWEQTYPVAGTHSVALSATQVVEDVDFGNRVSPGEISGSKWYDADQDGVRDGDEPGVEGWIIYLDQNQNGQRDPAETWTTTDANGDYSFTDLPPGTYTVAEEAQSGWTQTFPSGPSVDHVIVFDGANDDHFQTALTNLGLPFAVYGPGPTFGPAVAAADPATYLVIVSTSAPEPDYSTLIAFVNAGGRAILSTANLDGQSALATALDAQVATDMTSPASVYDWGGSPLFSGLSSPMAFAESGFYDDGDRLRPGTGGTAVAGFVSSPTTNQAAIIIGNDGKTIVDGFLMDNAVSNAAAVQMATNEIELLGGAGGAAGPHTVDLSPGETVSDMDFGNWAPAGDIQGSKWEDADADGVRDAGETGLEGWTIYLDRNQNGVRDAEEAWTVTDTNGDYVFTDLVPGTYVVAEELQADWAQTYPAGEGTHDVGVGPGEVVEDVDFGNVFAAVPEPDLAPTQFAVAPSGLLGNVSTSVTFGLHNGGDGDAGAFDVEFFWSDDASFANGEEIAADLVPSDPNYDPANPNAYHVAGGLLAGGGLTDTVAISVPRVDPCKTDGTYYLGMRLDESAAVSESDEANNHSQGVGLDMACVNWTRGVYVADFQDAEGNYEGEGFTYADDPDAPGTSLWHGTSHRAASGLYSQYYGRESVWDYDTGSRNAGALLSPLISLSGMGTPLVLSFEYFLETEGAAPARDAALVEISDDGGLTWNPVADNASGGGLTEPTSDWTTWQGCVSAYAGSEIILRFSFDTGDGAQNAFEGWYVDDVRILSSAPTLVFQEPTVGLELTGVPAELTAPEDEAFTFDFDTPIEVAGGSVSYLLLDAPVWLGMQNPGAGVISGMPTNARVGDFAVTLRTAKPSGTYVDHTLSLHVLNAAPTITSEPALAAVEGAPYAYQVASDDDPTANYVLLEGPAQLSIDVGRGLISGTFDGSAAGQYLVRVQVDDGHGGTDVQAFTLTVLGTAPAFVEPPAALAAMEDEAFAYDFGTDDEAGAGVVYSLLGAPGWLTVQDESAGVIAGIPRDGDAGEFQVTVRAENGWGGAEYTFTLSVENAPPRFLTAPSELTAVERRPFSFDFQTDDELQGGGVRYGLVEGPSWLRMADRSAGVVSGVPWGAAGACTVAVAARDADEAVAEHTFCLTVRQVDVWLPPRPIRPVADTPPSGRSGGDGALTGVLESDMWRAIQPTATDGDAFAGDGIGALAAGGSPWWLDGLPVGLQAAQDRLDGIRPPAGVLASVKVAPRGSR